MTKKVGKGIKKPTAPLASTKTLRSLLRRGAPAKLFGRGAFRGFCRIEGGKRVGHKLHGLTRRLEERVHSKGALPSITRTSLHARKGRRWKGKQAGRRRGVAVDAELTRLANGLKPTSGAHRLTKMVVEALRRDGVELVCGQRAVVSSRGNIATAADLVGLRGRDEIVLIELKTGYDQGREAAATSGGKARNLRAPVSGAVDCLTHRHLAQLAATHAMFVGDEGVVKSLANHGVEEVGGLLVYVTDNDVMLHDLPEWWSKRGPRIVDALV